MSYPSTQLHTRVRMKLLSKFMNRQGLWRGIAWGIAAFALIDGSSYSVKGNKIATGPSFSIIRDQVPGGMKVYGYAMLILGVLVIYASALNSITFSRRTMLGVFIFSLWMTVLTVAGWVHSHQVGISGLSKWFLILWVSLWLATTAHSYSSGGRDAQ